MSSPAKRPLRGLALAILLLFAAPALAGCLTFTDEPVPVRTTCEESATGDRNRNELEPIRIAKEEDGTRVPERSLTGEPIRILTFLGQDDGLRAAAELAAQELTDAGVRVELEHLSPSTDPQTVAATLRERLEREGAEGDASAVVGGLDNETTWELLEVAERHQVPVITPLAIHPNLTESRPNDGLFYRVTPGATFEGRVLADLVWDHGCRTAVVVVPPGHANSPLASGFRDAFGGKGGIVSDVLEVPRAGSVEDLAERIDRANPEAVVLALPSSQAAPVFRQLHIEEVTRDAATFLGPELESGTFADAAGTAREGHLLAAGLHGATLQRPAETFTARFENAYNHATGNEVGPHAAETYDAVYAVVLAAECAGSALGPDLHDELRTVWNRDTGDSHVSGDAPAGAISSARTCRADYVPVSAPSNPNWDARGEPTEALYRHWLVTEDGAVRATEDRLLVKA